MIILQLETSELQSIVSSAVNAGVRKALSDNQNSIANPSQASDEILNIKQASEFINLAIPTIYSLVSKREITSYKRGKKLYFKKTELAQWIQNGRRTPVSEIRDRAKRFNKAEV